MPIPLYLAMTGAEFLSSHAPPSHMAWMACHFSPYGTGITNCPTHLPPESMLILNDRMPPSGHDPQQIALQLSDLANDFACAGILLDLELPPTSLSRQIVSAIIQAAPCPVAVSAPYARETDCAVFLTPPLHIPLSEFLEPWKDREIWLEAALEDAEYSITAQGCRIGPLPCPPPFFPHSAPGAYSHYHIAIAEDAIHVSFRREQTDWEALAEEAENIRFLVGLYQQFK